MRGQNQSYRIRESLKRIPFRGNIFSSDLYIATEEIVKFRIISDYSDLANKMERVPQGSSLGLGAPGSSEMGSVPGGSDPPRDTIVGNECHVCGYVHK